MIICFIGPDGKVKNTYAKSFFSYMKSKGLRASYHELNYGLLLGFCNFKFIYKEKVLKDVEGEFHSGIKYPPYNPIKAALLTLYWSIDYALLRIHSALDPKRIFVFARYSLITAFMVTAASGHSKSLIISISPT